MARKLLGIAWVTKHLLQSPNKRREAREWHARARGSDPTNGVDVCVCASVSAMATTAQQRPTTVVLDTSDLAWTLHEETLLVL